jgi:hypothetical protein
MKNTLLCCMALSFLFSKVKAGETDSLKIKTIDHYVGVQANQLLRQLIDLNSSNNVVNNPYLLTYGLYSAKSNWGIELGFGFNYQKIKDNLSTTNQETKFNDSFYRIGVAKKFEMGKRWEAGLAMDYAGSYMLNKTFSFSVTEFNDVKDSTNTQSTSKIKTKGGGLRTHLRFGISKHIYIGTEMTFYFSKSINESNVTVSETFTNNSFPDENTYNVSTTNSELEESDFSMTLPVAIFLIIKF